MDARVGDSDEVAGAGSGGKTRAANERYRMNNQRFERTNERRSPTVSRRRRRRSRHRRETTDDYAIQRRRFIINLVRHLTGEDFAGGDDGGERTSGEHIDGGETGRILGTDVLRALLVHHLVRRRTTVVLLHARHEAESHRAHDGRRVEADDLRMN